MSTRVWYLNFLVRVPPRNRDEVEIEFKRWGARVDATTIGRMMDDAPYVLPSHRIPLHNRPPQVVTDINLWDIMDLVVERWQAEPKRLARIWKTTEHHVNFFEADPRPVSRKEHAALLGWCNHLETRLKKLEGGPLQSSTYALIRRP